MFYLNMYLIISFSFIAFIFIDRLIAIYILKKELITFNMSDYVFIFLSGLFWFLYLFYAIGCFCDYLIDKMDIIVSKTFKGE